MNRNLPYMKIAVCTSEVQIGEQIREYVDEFTGKGNAQIQVDVMKNCYRLAKKILNREHYDVICIGKNASGYRQLYLCLQHPYGRPGNHLFLPGWNRLNLNQIEHLAPVSYLSMPLSKEEFRKELYRTISHLGPGSRYLSFDVQGQKGRVLYRDIEYIRKSGNSVLVFTMKEMYRIPVPMTEVERELAGVEERFLRVHRDYLINGRYLSWLWNQEVGLMDGTRIPVSRIYRTRVERVVAENRKRLWNKEKSTGSPAGKNDSFPVGLLLCCRNKDIYREKYRIVRGHVLL